ncbi:MAG: competence protein CoiA family protein [Acidimicrobiales bacterium]|nr:competence protein CoiA family protein [Acidimicrobiales bacterium]
MGGTAKLRQEWAFDTVTGLLVRIVDGHAHYLKADCDSGRLICPMPDCTDPRVTPVTDHARLGHHVRAHFRHHGDGIEHRAESFFHLTAKMLVADWLRQRYADWHVDVERTVLVEPRRRPDVYARDVDGVEYAIEVQYSAITIDGWQARTNDVTNAGMRSIWLWGHVGTHHRADRDDPERVRISPLLRHVWFGGRRLHWIDPDAQQLVSLHPEAERFPFMTPQLVATPLAHADVVDGSLLTDPDRLALAHVEARRREAEERAAAQARLDAAAAAHRAAQLEAQRERELQHQAQRQAWEESELHAELVAKYGAVPPILAGGTPDQWRMRRHPALWRTQVFLAVVQGNVGRAFDYRDFCRPLFDGESSEDGYAALNGFLFALRQARFVAFRTRFGTRIDGGIHIRGDLDTPPPEPTPPKPKLLRTGPIRPHRPPPPDLTRLATSPEARAAGGRHPMFFSPEGATVRHAVASLADDATIPLSEILERARLSPDPETRTVVVEFLIALRATGAVIATDHDLYADGAIRRPPRETSSTRKIEPIEPTLDT